MDHLIGGPDVSTVYRLEGLSTGDAVGAMQSRLLFADVGGRGPSDKVKHALIFKGDLLAHQDKRYVLTFRPLDRRFELWAFDSARGPPAGQFSNCAIEHQSDRISER